jgi:heparan-alpha-glucosaminide N-acetyltransferase
VCAASRCDRIASIDIFRGLTVVVMIFVNDLSGVTGLPWWTYHMPENANGMTYVDMVFPAFLFILGMSIPLAVQRRMAKGETPGEIARHIVMRSLGLIIFGIFLANAEKVDPRLMGNIGFVWTLLAFLGSLIFWSSYPVSEKYKSFYRVLRYAGLLPLFWFAIVFRRTTPDGHAAWLDFSYWEILGLIGWVYLAVGLVYLFFRKNVWILITFLAAFIALNALFVSKWSDWLNHGLSFGWPVDPGLCSIAMAGLLTSLLFFQTRLTLGAKAISAAGYAVILAVIGWMLSPLGVSKERGTPSWCLYCTAANIIFFLLLYWIADVKRSTKWAAFAKPAGTNTLLTYMLPYVVYIIASIIPGLNRISGSASKSTGWIGLIQSLVFTSVVLLLSAILTRWKVRLQL